MSFKAYNQLRLLGFNPKQAVALADSFSYEDMYEQKDSLDNSSHAGLAPVIGLKPEFKQLVKEQAWTSI